MFPSNDHAQRILHEIHSSIIGFEIPSTTQELVSRLVSATDDLDGALPLITLDYSEVEYTCDNGLDAQQIIWQRIYHRNADGSMSHYDREAGTMTYHPTHGHNHTNDWGVFTLRKKDDNEPDPRNWPIVSEIIFYFPVGNVTWRHCYIR